MLNIYVVVEVGYDYETVLGVFTSMRKALAFARSKVDCHCYIEVRKYKPNSSEFKIVETIYRSRINRKIYEIKG